MNDVAAGTRAIMKGATVTRADENNGQNPQPMQLLGQQRAQVEVPEGRLLGEFQLGPVEGHQVVAGPAAGHVRRARTPDVVGDDMVGVGERSSHASPARL